jgi:hypothetical protein
MERCRTTPEVYGFEVVLKQAIISPIKTRVVRDTFTTPEDLAYKVAASLGRFLITSKVKSGTRRYSAEQ